MKENTRSFPEPLSSTNPSCFIDIEGSGPPGRHTQEAEGHLIPTWTPHLCASGDSVTKNVSRYASCVLGSRLSLQPPCRPVRR